MRRTLLALVVGALVGFVWGGTVGLGASDRILDRLLVEARAAQALAADCIAEREAAR